jgi:hypothetical protein
MVIKYELTIDDLVAFNLRVLQRSPSRRKAMRWLRLGLPPTVVIAIAVGLFEDGSWPSPLVAVSVAIALGAAIFIGLPRYLTYAIASSARRLYSEGSNRGLLDPTTLSLTPAAIETDTGLSANRRAWELVQEVDVAPEHIFFWTGSAEASIVPTRAFATDAEREEFIRLAKEYQQAGRESLGTNVRREAKTAGG